MPAGVEGCEKVHSEAVDMIPLSKALHTSTLLALLNHEREHFKPKHHFHTGEQPFHRLIALLNTPHSPLHHSLLMPI